MKQFFIGWVILVILFGGYANEKEFTRDTAEAEVLNLVPKCRNNLQTFNVITGIQETKTGYIFTVTQNCEPKNGEGPKMETIYTYSITPEEIKLLNKQP